MSWIKYQTHLHECPEVVRLASGLHTDVYGITGRLMKLWAWATQHSTDGKVNVGADWIDEYVSMPGFASAMMAAGWLQIDADSVTFPLWDRHLSNGAKSRAMDAERKKVSRKCPDANRTKFGPDKRREEKSTKTNPPKSPPAGGDLQPEKLGDERPRRKTKGEKRRDRRDASQFANVGEIPVYADDGETPDAPDVRVP